MSRAIVAITVLSFIGISVGAPSGAQAAAYKMEAVLADDPPIMEDASSRSVVLHQWREMGGTHIRINVVHNYGDEKTDSGTRYPFEAYDAAIGDINGIGDDGKGTLTPQVNLIWQGQSDSEQLSAWMGSVARHFGNRVNRYSVLNEPDLSLPANDQCDPEHITELIESHVLEVVKKRHRVKRFLYKVVIKRRGGKKIRKRIRVYEKVRLRFITAHGKVRHKTVKRRSYKWVRKTGLVAKSSVYTTPTDTMSIKTGCLLIMRGRMYHSIFPPAAEAIRQANPTAAVMAGETSPLAGVDMFMKQALPLPTASGWNHHPYQYTDPGQPDSGYGIGDCRNVRQLAGDLPLYMTEFGYPQSDSQWDAFLGYGFTESKRADYYRGAWRAAYECGVNSMAQFMWWSPKDGWDTSMTRQRMSLPPAYYAIQRELQRQRGV